MPPSSKILLLGEPDWVGMLMYAVIFLSCLGGFVLTVALIYLKVFRGGKQVITTINYEEAEGGTNERQ